MSLSICLVSDDRNILALNVNEIGEEGCILLYHWKASENLGGLTISSRGRGGAVSSR